MASQSCQNMMGHNGMGHRFKRQSCGALTKTGTRLSFLPIDDSAAAAGGAKTLMAAAPLSKSRRPITPKSAIASGAARLQHCFKAGVAAIVGSKPATCELMTHSAERMRRRIVRR